VTLNPGTLAKIDQNQATLRQLVEHVRAHRTACDVPSCIGASLYAALEVTDRPKLELVAALALYELAALPPPPTTLEELTA